MGRPEKPVDFSGGSVARFANELRRLREDAGRPTYRDMARCALYSASVLSSAANGHRLPTLHVALAYVRACGGDVEEWRHRWTEAQREDTRPIGSQAARSVRVLPSSSASRTPLSPLTPSPSPVKGRVATSAHPVTSAGSGSVPRPAQLPLRSRAFTGRRGALRRLAEGGSAAGPVVICGPAGIGKSELALAYAHSLAQDMVDGQLYADLGYSTASSAEPHAVVDGFLRALGVPALELPTAADQRIGLYRSLLAQRRVLVLLENACCERQVRPLLAESRLSVTIVVGREPLLGLSGVRRIRLGVLSRADSVAHIASVLPRRAQEDPAACDQIAALCGDLPLALDIATRKLAARPELSLRHVVERLREPRTVLDWLRIGDLSVREMLDTVYAQLDDASRTLLCRLARQGGARTGSHFEHRAILAPAGEEDHFEQLAEAGMLRWETSSGMYRVDPLVGAFVADLDRQPGVSHRRVIGPHPLPFHTLHNTSAGSAGSGAANRALTADCLSGLINAVGQPRPRLDLKTAAERTSRNRPTAG